MREIEAVKNKIVENLDGVLEKSQFEEIRKRLDEKIEKEKATRRLSSVQQESSAASQSVPKRVSACEVILLS